MASQKESLIELRAQNGKLKQNNAFDISFIINNEKVALEDLNFKVISVTNNYVRESFANDYLNENSDYFLYDKTIGISSKFNVSNIVALSYDNMTVYFNDGLNTLNMSQIKDNFVNYKKQFNKVIKYSSYSGFYNGNPSYALDSGRIVSFANLEELKTKRIINKTITNQGSFESVIINNPVGLKIKEINERGLTREYSYNQHGSVTQILSYNNADVIEKMINKFEYTDDGNQLSYVYDQRLSNGEKNIKSQRIVNDNTGLIEKYVQPSGGEICYLHNSNGLLERVYSNVNNQQNEHVLGFKNDY